MFLSGLSPDISQHEGRRETVTLRVTRGLRERLKEKAEGAGRSLSQEIELRLEKSFWQDDSLYASFGGDQRFRFMQLIAVWTQIFEGLSAAGKNAGEDLLRLLTNSETANGLEASRALGAILRKLKKELDSAV